MTAIVIIATKLSQYVVINMAPITLRKGTANTEIVTGDKYVDLMLGRLTSSFLVNTNKMPARVIKLVNINTGVIENGLFIDLVDEVIVGGKQGIITLEEQCLQ